MTAIIDISGRRFGFLTALEVSGRDRLGRTLWLCECDCGATHEASSNNLRTGNTKSCGCRKHPRGSDNPRTITCKKRLAERKRSYAANRHWRKVVLARHKRCAKCGGVDDLHAHHILGYSEYPELRAEPDNGIALCGCCHLQFHLLYGRRSGFNEANLCEWLFGIDEAPMLDSESVEITSAEWDIIQAVATHRNKNGRQDIEKAIHYLQLLLEAEYPAEHIYKGCRRCEGYAMCVCPPKQPDPI